MNGEKTTREMIAENNQDVKWMCRMLERMERMHCDYEDRLRDLEGWRSTKVGEERKVRQISAGIEGLVGGFVALLFRIFWN